MEEKKRFKMYKSGKNWVIAPIVFLGLTAGLGHQANVKADNVSSTAKADNETTQKATSTSLNDQKSSCIKEQRQLLKQLKKRLTLLFNQLQKLQQVRQRTIKIQQISRKKRL